MTFPENKRLIVMPRICSIVDIELKPLTNQTVSEIQAQLCLLKLVCLIVEFKL